MPRHKDMNWNLPEGTPNHTFDSIHAALLMDIRDELKKVNNTLNCHNAMDIPNILRRISRNTHKKKRRPRTQRTA